MKHNPDRRSFLAVTSTGALGAIAGCSNLNSQSQNGDADPDTDGGDNSGTTATLTVQVQPDQEELRTLQGELQEEIQNGETSQQEARQQIQQKQTELTEEAVTAYEEAVAGDDNISVDNSEPEYGILQVTAPAATFVSALQNGDVAALLPEAYYEQFIQQQQRQQNIQEQLEEQAENSSSSD